MAVVLHLDALLWFREGPQTRHFRPDSDLYQPQALWHEMSSFECCYSWNVFHSWQLGDRNRFLEGMYSLFAGAMSRQTYSVCESRGGISGTTHWTPEVYLARLAVIDDAISEGELHLLRLVPLAWLRTDREAVFERIPTYYGPVSLRVKLDDGGRTLYVNWRPEFRTTPKRTVLHIPPVDGLSRVVLNGRSLDWNETARTIEIPGRSHTP